MAVQAIGTLEATFPFSLPNPRVLIRRMLAMATLWMLFGMVVGCALMPGNAIGLLSGAIAGALVLPWLGLVLGMLGGNVMESLVGALAGSLVAMLSAILGGNSVHPFNLDLCLIIGGMIGANFVLLSTAWAWLRQRRLPARA